MESGQVKKGSDQSQSTSELAEIDEQELKRLLLQYDDNLRRYIGLRIPFRLSGILSSDDILQEVWIAAFRAAPSFRQLGPNAFEKWIGSIVLSKLVDAIKSARRLKRGGNLAILQAGSMCRSSLATLFAETTSGSRTPSIEYAAEEARSEIQQALERLPQDRRQAIQLHYIEDCTIPDIAAQMRKTVPAVKGLIFHGVRQLRKEMGRMDRFFSADTSTGSSAAER